MIVVMKDYVEENNAHINANVNANKTMMYIDVQ